LELEKGIPASPNHLLAIEEASAPFDLHEWSFGRVTTTPLPQAKITGGETKLNRFCILD